MNEYSLYSTPVGIKKIIVFDIVFVLTVKTNKEQF